LAIAGLAAASSSPGVKAACIAVVVAHAFARKPPRPTTVLRYDDGSWALPERGLERLALGDGTSVGPFWISLRLGAGTASASVLLLRDQLDRETWRALRAELGRVRPTRSI
jgi:hypothetical protein